MKKMRRQGVALVLVLGLLLQTITYIPTAFAAATAASAEGNTTLGEVTLAYKQTLLEQREGSYKLTLFLDAQAEHYDQNVNSFVARNGYYTAPADGKYLVELWGGSGGNGGGTEESPAGTGGSGGYIYGIVNLKKGETLFYSLGGNGSSTQSSNTGGGANGPGGSGGSLTSTTIGAGGGYSAVYLYGIGEFESGYFAADGNYGGNSVSESDRTSRHIMVAGGGGGGGGSSTDGTYAPDGGAGGNMSSTAVTVTGGTVFAGANGSSSDDMTRYVGQGGTDVPGEYSKTWTGWLESIQANDWIGSVNTELAGGAGGMSNLRGGAGGAGYNGGGGGIMSSLFTATSIGGGGGGASYMADSVNYADVDTSKLTKTNQSTSGGAISIQILDIDTSYLGNVNVSFAASPYFELSVQGTPSGVDLNQENLTLELLFTPKDGFAGGNAVPLLENELVTITAGAYTTNIYLQPDCSSVNVPLNFVVNTNTQEYKKSEPDATIPTVSGMYTDSYATDMVANAWRYDFISSISDYIVTDPSNDDAVLAATSEVTPVATTMYPVSITVTPKSGTPAVVGDPVTETVFVGYAPVVVTQDDQFVLGDSTVTYEKELTNNGNGTFTLSLMLSAEMTTKTYSVDVNTYTPAVPDANKTEEYITSTETKTFTAPYAGWYYVEVFGGDGGNGSAAQLGGKGGTGATGSNIRCYVHLEKDQILSFVIGEKGADGVEQGSGTSRVNPGGIGGGYSVVYDLTTSTPIIVAGGGGGGGGASGGQDGESASENSTIEAIISDLANYVGGDGNQGTYTFPFTWTGGAAGASVSSAYKKSDNISVDKPSDVTSGTPIEKSEEAGNDGYARVTWLQSDTITEITYSDSSSSSSFDAEEYMNMLVAKLQGYVVTADISKYFDVSGVTLLEGTESSVLDYTTSGQTITISGINPTVVDNEGDEAELSTSEGEHTFAGRVSFAINILLTPTDGFLGGNDVPLLKYGEPGSTDTTTSMTLGRGSESPVNVPRITETDYVNVAITKNGITGDVSVPGAPEIVRGDSVFQSELYAVTDFILPTGINAWKADFVNFNSSLVDNESGKTVTEDPLSPTETTYYTVILSVDPKADPIKVTNLDEFPAATGVKVAKVGETQESGDIVVIYVLPVVEYHLTNLNNEKELDGNNRYAVTPYGAHFEDTLSNYTALDKKVYLLPDSITITRTSGNSVTTLTEGADYTYSSATGKIWIENSVLDYDLITIYAEGVLKEPLSITYHYQTNPTDEEGTSVTVGGLGYDYFDSGTVLTDDNAQTPTHTEYSGYTFGWQWLGYGDTRPATIIENLTAIGTYRANAYTLTVRYTNASGKELLEPTTLEVLYGNEYTVTAPAIDNYAPEQPSITGIMDSTDGKEVTFIYNRTSGQLTVSYVYEDGSKAAETSTTDIALNGEYTIDSPAIAGYTPNLSQVFITGVTQSQVNQGIVVTVTYTPNIYTITFDPAFDTDEGSCDTTPYKVEYDNVYGYDPENDEPKYLPQPVWPGYTFDGWYLSETLIEDDTTVKITSDSELVARWTEIVNYTLVVKYVFEDDSLAAQTYTVALEVGTEYSVTSPEIDGYTPDQTTVAGTMGNQNIVITVTYVKNAKSLTVYYCYADGTMIDAGLLTGVGVNPVVVELEKGQTFEPVLPEISGYNTPESVTLTMGETAMEYTIYYTVENIENVIAVTVEWGTLTFVFDRGEWQPETHTYESGSTFTPEKTGYNWVSVTNSTESTVPVDVTVTFTSDPDKPAYESVSGYFTTVSYSTGDVIVDPWTLAVGENKVFYLWLTGTPDSSVTGTDICGSCTVTITGGG